jgi:hypothetical protein
MAHKTNIQLVSIALMTIGIGLAYWGYDMSGGLDSQLNQAFTGSSSDGVMIRYIGGAACFVTGLFLFLKK